MYAYVPLGGVDEGEGGPRMGLDKAALVAVLERPVGIHGVVG